MYFLRWETSHIKMQICVKNISLTAEGSLWKKEFYTLLLSATVGRPQTHQGVIESKCPTLESDPFTP